MRMRMTPVLINSAMRGEEDDIFKIKYIEIEIEKEMPKQSIEMLAK